MKTLLLMLLLASPAFSDTAPFYIEIFNIKNSQFLIACSDLSAEDFTCDHPIVDKKKASRISLTGGEGSWYTIVTNKKNIDEKSCQVEIEFDDKSKGPLKISCHLVKNIETVSEEILNLVEETSYIFHPTLKPDLELKDNPNKIIGTVDIDRTISFSYPSKGSWQLNAQKIQTLLEKKVSLPVIRKDKNKFLVEINQELYLKLREAGDMKGILTSTSTEVLRAYSWIESQGAPLAFRPVNDTPLQNVKFAMNKGSIYVKDSQKWISFKVYALYPDFNIQTPMDADAIEEDVQRNKIFLKEIHLPVLNKDGQINFWHHWEPGC